MKCYLCNSQDIINRKGTVRDAPDLKILECNDCGLVYLDSQDHINDKFYEQSGMHESESNLNDTCPSQILPIDSWLKGCEWDDSRRLEMSKPFLFEKKLLDFGCGSGGFLKKAQKLARVAEGVELEQRIRAYWQGQILIYPDVDSVDGGPYDVITAFHVIEHLSDPRKVINALSKLIAKGGRLILEVPNSADVLLTLYDSTAFQKFTYWSPHLFLFNADTLRRLAVQSGMRVVAIQQYQRYPLSNHLYWLSQHKPGGHSQWAFLDSPELTSAYEKSLAAMGRCDTLIAHLEVN